MADELLCYVATRQQQWTTPSVQFVPKCSGWRSEHDLLLGAGSITTRNRNSSRISSRTGPAFGGKRSPRPSGHPEPAEKSAHRRPSSGTTCGKSRHLVWRALKKPLLSATKFFMHSKGPSAFRVPSGTVATRLRPIRAPLQSRMRSQIPAPDQPCMFKENSDDPFQGTIGK